MSADALKIINKAMDELGLNYQFMEWKGEPQYPYFTGEYSESEATSENGMQEATFILNGFSRSTWEVLETAKALIEDYFNKIYGITAIAETGNAVAIFYSNSTSIPVEDAELKRIQINLTIKEWKVN